MASTAEQLAANLQAVVRAAVHHQDDLVAARDPQLLQRANQLGDTAGAIVDRDHDRERQTGRAACRNRLPFFSHDRPPFTAMARIDPPKGNLTPRRNSAASSAVAARQSISTERGYSLTSLTSQ